jgi:SAM-dependent methyltransferase
MVKEPNGPGMADDPGRWTTSKSDSVELRVLDDLLSGVDCGKVLELGAGTGRLLQLLHRRSHDIVAVDANSARVRSVARQRSTGDTVQWVVADGSRLPFAPASFGTVILVRVLHLFPEPERLIAEIRRVLATGGTLVLSYYPRPSLRTLQFRFWAKIRSGGSGGRSSRSDNSGSEDRRVHTVGGPYSTSAILGVLESAGFEIEERVGTGLEEISGLDRLPVSFFHRLSRGVPRAWGYPAHFARLRAIGPLAPGREPGAPPRHRF